MELINDHNLSTYQSALFTRATISTANYFKTGLLPVSNLPVEYHMDYDNMDPVFNPQLTNINEQFKVEALQQMQENEVKPIHEKVLKAIETVGKKNGFAQIYDISANSNVVYYNPAFYTDVTSLVKKELGLKEPFSTAR